MRVEVIARDFLRLAFDRREALLEQARLQPDLQFSMLMCIGSASLVESSARRAFQSAVDATCLADDLAFWSCLNVLERQAQSMSNAMIATMLASKRLKYARAWRRAYRRTHGV